MEFFVTLALLLHIGHIISKFAPKKKRLPTCKVTPGTSLAQIAQINPASGMDPTSNTTGSRNFCGGKQVDHIKYIRHVYIYIFKKTAHYIGITIQNQIVTIKILQLNIRSMAQQVHFPEGFWHGSCSILQTTFERNKKKLTFQHTVLVV